MSGQSIGHKEDLVWKLSKHISEIIMIATTGVETYKFDRECSALFNVMRAAKKLRLLPQELEVSSKTSRIFIKDVRAWGKLKTAQELRSLIAQDLKSRGLPEGMCDLIELGGEATPQETRAGTDHDDSDDDD